MSGPILSESEVREAGPIVDQPPPAASEGPAVWPLVIADVAVAHLGRPALVLVLGDMRARDQLGRERYGTPLRPHNGRDALVDAYYEALDLSAYLRQAILEGTDRIATAYDYALETALLLRALIARRPSTPTPAGTTVTVTDRYRTIGCSYVWRVIDARDQERVVLQDNVGAKTTWSATQLHDPALWTRVLP